MSRVLRIQFATVVSFTADEIQGACAGSRPGAMFGATFPLENLRHTARHLLNNAIAPNSRLTYNTALNMFKTFRRNHMLLDLWPIPVLHIILFLSFCFEKGLSPRSITTYLAGVNYFHKLKGFNDFSDH